MISDSIRQRVVNRKIAQLFTSFSEVGYEAPDIIEGSIKNVMHKLSRDLIIEISKDKENSNYETNYNR